MSAFAPPPRPIEYLFVDGASLTGYLTNLSNRFFNHEVFELDFDEIAKNYNKVFYYDAIPTRNEGELEADYQNRIAPQLQSFKWLRSTDGLHVYVGVARR